MEIISAPFEVANFVARLLILYKKCQKSFADKQA